MNETRQQLKERLKAAGHWPEYLTLRGRLAADGLNPAQARKEALRQIESRPPQQADPPTTDGPDDDSPISDEEWRAYLEGRSAPPLRCEACTRCGLRGKGCSACRAVRASARRGTHTEPPALDQSSHASPVEEDFFTPPPLCKKCYPLRRPLCDVCRENAWKARVAFCEKKGRDPGCSRCYWIGQPACADCLKKDRTVERLRSAGFPEEARWLEDWIERHLNDPPADAQVELLLRLPPRLLVDMRLVHLGRV